MPHPDETRDLPDPPTASHIDRADPTHSHVAPDRTAGYDGDPPGHDARTPGDSADAIPGYAILEKIGEGGMGVVYRARQLGLNREVAVKCVLRADANRAAVARFWAEAEVMAAVRHPHVVQVFELGEHAGRPFMAMELVPGGSLADRLKGAAPMPPRSAAELVERIARGVAAAHEQGIVHRDLKPGNVLLAADGTPKVTDFGLAKRRATDLTRTQAVMGTPAYMAPEQAAGRAKFVGPPADVWALGVILYECVAGARPFEGDTAQVVLSQIQSAEPAALRARVRGVPRDLDTIVGRCLAKEPEHRYPTAAELADDLGRFVRGEPIAARPVGRAERFARWVRRKPTAAAAWGFSALAVLLALVVFVVAGFWREAEGARGQAETARDEAVRLRGIADEARAVADTARAGEADARGQVERERDKLARVEYARTIQVAHREWRENRIAAALALLDGTRADLRGWEWRYVHRLCNGQSLTLKGHTGPVRSVAWSPDGGRLVTVADGDLYARVWDARTGAEVLALTHPLRVWSAAWSPDDRGGRILTTSHGTARVWDAKTGAELVTLKRTGQRAVWSPDGSRVLVGGGNSGRTAGVCDARTGAEVVTLTGHTDDIKSADWSPDGAKVLTAGDTTARVWDAKDGTEVLTLKVHDLVYLTSAAWGPDGGRVLTVGGHFDPAARVWDVKTGVGAELRTPNGRTYDVASAVWSPDGAQILTRDRDGPVGRFWHAKGGSEPAVRAWGGGVIAWSADGTKVVTADAVGGTLRVRVAGSGDVLRTLSGHDGGVHAVAWSPDGGRVATAGHDGTARVWDADDGAEPRRLKARESGREVAVAWSSDGTKVVGANVEAGATARVWDATTGAALLTLRARDARAAHAWAGWSPDGSRVVTTAEDGTARVWDAKTGAELRTLRLTPDGFGQKVVVRAAWSPDGARLATGGGWARVWDVKTWAEVLTLKGGGPDAAWSPDGGRLVTTDSGGARVWDATTGAVLSVLKDPGFDLGTAAWSPDGARVLTVRTYSSFGTATWAAKVWDAKTGAELLVLRGHTADIQSAAWSPDGARVVTAGKDGTARVWDATTGAELLTLKGHHTFHVLSAAWSPDGARILTDDGRVRVWDARVGVELLTLEGHVRWAAPASWSPDGTRVLASGVWDATPLDRQFLPKEPAPPWGK